MNKFERWFLKRVFREQVRQGADHDRRITELYTMIREAAEAEFTEDNIPTLNDSLVVWFHSSLRQIEPACVCCGTTKGLFKDGWYGYRCHSEDCMVF